MNLRDLEYVEAIARYLSFSRAASACNVSQPALSNQIKKLEQELGAELFHRSMQEVRPTEFGARVMDCARTVLVETEKIRDLAAEYRDPAALPLRIGLTPTLAPYLMHYLCGQIRKLMPEIRISVVEEASDQLTDMVANREIDIALTPHNGCGGRLEFSPLFDEPLFLAVRSGHRIDGLDSVGLEDIPSDELICPRSPLGIEAEADMHRCLPDAAKDAHLDVTAVSFETVCRHVCASGGCTIVPALAAEQFKRDGWDLAFVRIRETGHRRRIGVVSRVGCPRKPLLYEICSQIHLDPPCGVEPASEPALAAEAG